MDTFVREFFSVMELVVCDDDGNALPLSPEVSSSSAPVSQKKAIERINEQGRHASPSFVGRCTGAYNDTRFDEWWK
jgi:hypothetical protein